VSAQLKIQICNALAEFIRQRSGAKSHQYGDPAAWRQFQREIGRDKVDAETLLARVRGEPGITADDLIRASKEVYDGWLEIELGMNHYRYADGSRSKAYASVAVDYKFSDLGQSFPVKYRKAVAAICAYALKEYTRKNEMPPSKFENRDSIWLRHHFRREYGSRLQRRWFD
jgi:hypothetical protein